MENPTEFITTLSDRVDARTVRWLTGIAGGALVLLAGRASWTGAALAAAGGVLIGRSLFSGGSIDDAEALRRAGTGTERSAPAPSAAPRDPVDRASYESFPASDPPGFTSSTGAPKLKD